MARTNLTKKQIRRPYNTADNLALYTKFAEHDTALDALESGTTSSVVTIHPVDGASTGNVASLAAFTVANDGITLVATNRVLLKNQSTASQNGIYVVGTVAGGTAPLTRATDWDAAAEVKVNTFVAVGGGTAGANTIWQLTGDFPMTVGTSDQHFVQVYTSAQINSTASGKGASLVGLGNALGLVGTDGATDNVEEALNYDIATGNGLPVLAPVRRVRAVSTSNLASFSGISETFDGLTLVAGNRILVVGQSAPAENGIYRVGVVTGGVADWVRAVDFAAAAVVPNGTMFVVDAGTAGANRVYKLTNAGTITVGTTGLTFERLYTSTEFPTLAGVIQKKTVSIDHASLTGASTATNIGTALPTSAIVLAHEINVTEQYDGEADTTIIIGGTDTDAIVASTDLDALAIGKYPGTLGAHPTGSFSAEQLVCTIAATDLTHLTAGTITVTVWYTVLA